jgi:alanine dehydrogenase
MLILGREDVERLLDLDALIDALAATMADVSAGRASVPDRIAAWVAERDGLLAAMPGYVPASGALVAKLVSVFPRNGALGIPTHQAVIGVFDPETGSPLALLDGTSITAIRTGAGSALSVRLLARRDATTLAIVGTGVQALSHARAVTRVREIREIRVAGRDGAKAQSLAAGLGEELGIATHAAGSYAEAMAGAHIVCGTTHAHEPVIRRAWLDPGTHVTSVGYDPTGREVDDETVADALVCVESRRAVLAAAPAGSPDILQPVERGLIRPDDLREIGELVARTAGGRTGDEQLTLYKSVGIAAQDAAAATLVLAAARERGAGRDVEL